MKNIEETLFRLQQHIPVNLTDLIGDVSLNRRGSRARTPRDSLPLAGDVSLNRRGSGARTPRGSLPWAIPCSKVQLTSEELGRGRWQVIRVAHYKEHKVAAHCFQTTSVSGNFRKLLQENLDVVATLRHPNILTFLGTVMEGKPMILTELIPTNLKSVLDMGMLNNYQISAITVDIASALVFLHTLKPDPVIHGDFTSTRIYLQKVSGGMWKAKISDFMTATFFQKLVDSGEPGMELNQLRSPSQTSSRVLGSPSSPVQGGMVDLPSGIQGPKSRRISLTGPDMQGGDAHLSVQRDVYSFGILLVELCTGTSPLEVSLHFLLESITWTSMATLVKACMESDPTLRPSIESILVQLKSIHRDIQTVKAHTRTKLTDNSHLH